MEIIEKIQLLCGVDLDEERLKSISCTCREMVTPLQIDLAFYENDQTKLEIIQSKQKEAKEKIKETAIKAQYALELYSRHLDIEFKKLSNHQPFNIPVIMDNTSIFKEKIIRMKDDGYDEEDHVECALVNAQKATTDSLVWILFYSELEDMELVVKEEMGLGQQKELAENTSSGKEDLGELKIDKIEQTAPPINVLFLSSKLVQIFRAGGAELFAYLQVEYTVDDQSPVAKYSYIYRFLAQKQFIMARSQSKYVEFIHETFGVKMSKIFPESNKYTDDIYPLLSRVKSNFEKRNKSEINQK